MAAAVTAAGPPFKKAVDALFPGSFSKDFGKAEETGGEVYKEVLCVSENGQETYEFPETILENETVYFLDSVSREIVSERGRPRESHNIRVVMTEEYLDSEENYAPVQTVYLESLSKEKEKYRQSKPHEPGREKQVQTDKILTLKVSARYVSGAEFLKPLSVGKRAGRWLRENLAQVLVGAGITAAFLAAVLKKRRKI